MVRQIWYLRTHHQQCLTQSSTTLSEHFVGVEWNDIAERKDERVDVFHVQIVCGDSVRDGVLCETLRLLDRVSDRQICQSANSRCHELWVKVDRVVAQFCFGDRFEALTTLRQIRISLDPSSVRQLGLSLIRSAKLT
jgi:hypothetical protein